MAINWRGQAQQVLQQAMHARRPEKVLTAHDLGHALEGVIDYDRKMVAGRRLLARQHHVAPSFRMSGNDAGFAIGALAEFDPAEIASKRTSLSHVEPQRKRRAGLNQSLPPLGG